MASDQQVVEFSTIENILYGKYPPIAHIVPLKSIVNGCQVVTILKWMCFSELSKVTLRDCWWQSSWRSHQGAERSCPRCTGQDRSPTSCPWLPSLTQASAVIMLITMGSVYHYVVIKVHGYSETKWMLIKTQHNWLYLVILTSITCLWARTEKKR